MTDKEQKMEDLSSKLILVNRQLNDLWLKEYRCRYDEITLKQMPLKPGEKMHECSECNGCPFDGKMEDPFCRKFMQHHAILSKMDKIAKSA